MLVRMLVAQAGVDFLRHAGAVLNIDGQEAARLIARGYAEPVRASEPERAVDRRLREKAVR